MGISKTFQPILDLCGREEAVITNETFSEPRSVWKLELGEVGKTWRIYSLVVIYAKLRFWTYLTQRGSRGNGSSAFVEATPRIIFFPGQ